MSAILQHARPAPAAPARPQLRVVSPSRHPGRYLLLGLCLLAAGVFGIVSLNALAAEAAFEARNLEREVTELSLRYDELTAAVATLESPDRVRQVAMGQLGMTAAVEPEFLVLDPGIGTDDGGRGVIQTAPLGADAVADPVKQAMASDR